MNILGLIDSDGTSHWTIGRNGLKAFFLKEQGLTLMVG